jgi:hypothetical protein
VTAEDPGWTFWGSVQHMMAMMFYSDLTGWHADPYPVVSYSDPHREMLRVAGQGAWLAERYEFLASLYVTAWSFGIPGPLTAEAADGRVFRIHALERMMKHELAPETVFDTIATGTRYLDANYPETVVYWGGRANPRVYVVVERATGKIRNVRIYRRLSATRYTPFPF